MFCSTFQNYVFRRIFPCPEYLNISGIFVILFLYNLFVCLLKLYVNINTRGITNYISLLNKCHLMHFIVEYMKYDTIIFLSIWNILLKRVTETFYISNFKSKFCVNHNIGQNKRSSVSFIFLTEIFLFCGIFLWSKHTWQIRVIITRMRESDETTKMVLFCLI